MPSGDGGIFISYRRGETAWPARQLYEVLVARFGSGTVFKDVDDIEPGEDFVERITDAVAACDVLLALIGPHWLTMTDASGARRLDDPEDFVRLELSAALSRGVRVVPILVDGARMPRADELPPDLAPITRRQAVEISPVGFNTERLIASLTTLLARPSAGGGSIASGAPGGVAPPEPSPTAEIDGGPPAPSRTAREPTEPFGRSDGPISQASAPDTGSLDVREPRSPVPDPEAWPPAPDESSRQPADQAPPQPWAGASAGGGNTPAPGRMPSLDRGTAAPSFAAPMRQVWNTGQPQQGAAPGAAGGSGANPPGSAASAFGAPGPGAHPVREDQPNGAVANRSARPSPNRRLPLLIGAGATVAALLAGALVWHPWTGLPTSSGPVTTPPTSVGSTQPPSAVPSGTAEPADLPNPPIMAHRGGLERHQLETQEAMEDAARRGFAVETDVRYTKDGVAVLVHDEAATKGLDCGGKDVRVSQTSLADLRKLCRSKPTAADSRTYAIPTLDATLEAIAAASPTSWVFLEVKTDESDAKLAALLATPGKYGLSDRTVFTSFTRDRLARVAKADKSFRRMLFVSGSQVPAATIAKDGLWGVAVENSIADTNYVKSLQKVKLKVVLWNPNEAKAWARVSPMGADVLMTDYPEKYQEWLAKR